MNAFRSAGRLLSRAAILVFCFAAFYSCRTFDIQYYDESKEFTAARTVRTVASLPEKKENDFRVVQLTDLHYVAAAEERYLAMIDAINRSGADLLLFTGDFMSEENLPDSVVQILSRLQPDCTKIAVRGNWEVASRHPLLPEDFDFRSFFADAGFIYLADQPYTLRTKNGGVHVYGFDSVYADPLKYEPLAFPANGIVIVVAHEPARFTRNDICGYGLRPAGEQPPLFMFSGHTHGGQITCFGLPLYLPRYSASYQSGRYTYGANVLYVSAGAGQGRYNIRVGAPYDFLVVDIPAALFFRNTDSAATGSE